jgi:anti-sigma regulatory factor (Ser/Thr protein kinase)
MVGQTLACDVADARDARVPGQRSTSILEIKHHPGRRGKKEAMTGRGMTGERPVHVAQHQMTNGELPRPPTGFTHAAMFYDGEDDLVRLGSMLHGATEADDALQVAVPDGTMRLLGEQWRPAAGNVGLVNMAELGRNPARIIAAGQAFVEGHRGQHVSCIWEPAWPSRSQAELREVARHEALCNLAFRERPVTILCLYDTKRLGEDVISSAELTHPIVISPGEQQQANGTYLGPGRFPPGSDEPLPPPAADAATMAFGGRLGQVREFSASRGHAAGLDGARVSDLVLAVSEIAANALGHAGGGGVIRSWCTSEEILCQVEDHGYISDPLAGRYRKPADAQGGHGLWLVNRVCDLVERRSSPAGTVTRLHMRRQTGAS